MPKMENPCKARSLEQIRDKYADAVTDQMLRFAREVQKDSFRRCAEICRSMTLPQGPVIADQFAQAIEREGGL